MGSCAGQASSGVTATDGGRLGAHRGRAVYALFVLLILTGNGFTRIGPFPISVRNLWRNSRVLAVILALLILVSPRARSFAREWIGSIAAFMLIAAAAAFLMSLGPEIRSGGRLISEVGPYHFFYWYVPGFDGLRVPARFAMLVMLFLSIAAGLGAAAIERRLRRGGAIAVVLGALAVAEAFAAPIVINGTVAEGATRRRRRAFIPATRCPGRIAF